MINHQIFQFFIKEASSQPVPSLGSIMKDIMEERPKPTDSPAEKLRKLNAKVATMQRKLNQLDAGEQSGKYTAEVASEARKKWQYGIDRVNKVIAQIEAGSSTAKTTPAPKLKKVKTTKPPTKVSKPTVSAPVSPSPTTPKGPPKTTRSIGGGGSSSGSKSLANTKKAPRKTNVRLALAAAGGLGGLGYLHYRHRNKEK